MPVIQQKRILCTICGQELTLTMIKSLLRTSKYGYRLDGKKYPVYEYVCPYCQSEAYISQKFLDDLGKD